MIAVISSSAPAKDFAAAFARGFRGRAGLPVVDAVVTAAAFCRDGSDGVSFAHRSSPQRMEFQPVSSLPDKVPVTAPEPFIPADRQIAEFTVRAVVLAAEGPAFCAGANLNWMRRMADYTQGENIADAGKLAEMLRVIYECPKPTIARVQGDVYAGGMGLVAARDKGLPEDSFMACERGVSFGYNNLVSD
eukprot:gene44551-60344_t